MKVLLQQALDVLASYKAEEFVAGANVMETLRKAIEASEPVVTGWDTGLSQDYDRKLGKWFADQPGARQQLRTDLAQLKLVCPSCQAPGLMYECIACSASNHPKGMK